MTEANRKIIKNKAGPLNLAEQLGNVSRACNLPTPYILWTKLTT